jgi:hypothetical protein
MHDSFLPSQKMSMDALIRSLLLLDEAPSSHRITASSLRNCQLAKRGPEKEDEEGELTA